MRLTSVVWKRSKVRPFLRRAQGIKRTIKTITLTRLTLHVTLTDTLADESPHKEQPHTHNIQSLRYLAPSALCTVCVSRTYRPRRVGSKMARYVSPVLSNGTQRV